MNFRFTGAEKALLGAEISSLGTFLAQVQQTGQMTLREFIVSLAVALLTGYTVWNATNTPTLR